MKEAPTYHYLWAKTPPLADSLDYLPLLYHLLDVGAVVRRLLEREGERLQLLYARDLGLPGVAEVLAWVPALAALHDLGKAFPTFQAKWKPHYYEQLQPASGLPLVPGLLDVPHGIVSEALLQVLLPTVGFARRLARNLSDALGRHHGFASDREVLSSTECEIECFPPAWNTVQREIMEAVFLACGCSGLMAPTAEELDGGGFMRVAGLVSFADWIGSNQAFFTPYRGDGSAARLQPSREPSKIYAESLAIAGRALDVLDWPGRVCSHKSFEEIFGFSPRALQRVTIELIEASQGPTLLLVEAPMGEGKTEAALYAHTLLQRQQESRGLYFALPTQATGNAMFERVAQDYLSKLGVTGVDLQLMHGAAMLNEQFEQMQVSIDSDYGADQEVIAREWFSHKKRGLLSPNAVGTIDQALLGVLNVKHQFVRMWGLGRRTIIFDEVHAYELYTHTLLQRLISWLKSMDCNVILLSATLPSQARQSLVAGFGGRLPDRECQYPRVTRVSNGEAVSRDFEVRASSFTLRSCSPELENMAVLLEQLSAESGAVGCVVNTVSRAQSLFRLLRERIPHQPMLLLHARFPVEQRLKLEERLAVALGKASQPAQRNLLVVATQVVEQSLDIDFDVLVTDLAPVDLVLQRSGRLHRHSGRVRPLAFTKAEVYVAGLPVDQQLPALRAYSWSYVYSSYHLYRSAWILAQFLERTISLPGDLQGKDSMVERCYSDVSLDWPVEWDVPMLQSLDRMRRKLDGESVSARLAQLPDPSNFCDQPPERFQLEEEESKTQSRLLAQTRLGDPSLTLLLYEATPEGLKTMAGRRFEMSSKVLMKQAKEWLRETVKVSHPPMVQHFLANPPTQVWRKSALLRSVVPVLMVDGIWAGPQFRMQLHKDWGLVIERTSPDGEGSS